MKRFLIKVSLFSLILILTSNLMFYIISESELIQGPYFSDSGYEWLQTLGNKPQLVFLGPSTAKLGLSCSVVGQVMNFSSGEVVNLATDAQTPVGSYYIFKKYNKYFQSRYIVAYILEPWVCSEYYYRMDGVLSVRWGLSQRLFFISSPKDYVRILFGGNFAFAFKKISRNYIEPNYTIPYDFGSNVILRNVNVTNFKEPIEEWFEKSKFRVSNYQIEYIEKLKTAVESSGNTFILLLLPKVEEWTSDYKVKLKDYDDELVSKLNTKLGKTIILGSFSLVPKDLMSDMFVDNVHLNNYGQEFVSSEIAKKLRSTPFTKEVIKNLYEY